jgi:hypothetical protein
MHSPWVGVDLAADQVAWARLLKCAHDVSLSGRGTSAVLRDVIAASWARCMDAGVDPDRPAPRVLNEHETQERLDAHPLGSVVALVRELLGDVAQDARHLTVLGDADGLLLWAQGHSSMVEAAGKPRFLPGCLCSEEEVGTNAIGTALALNHAVQVFSAEHFNRLLHGWTDAAAPIRDPETNQPLGVVGLSGSFRRAHPHTLALVKATARLCEGQLAASQAARDRALQARYLDLVARSRPGRSALVGRGGRVLAAAPSGWLGHRLQLPPEGGELNLAGGPRLAIEPLGADASVVWDAGAQRGPPRPHLELDALGRDRAEVELLGRRIVLGRRHSELVVLLALHPHGMTGEELAHAVYGAGGSEVTVRAEIARLRRRLEGLVASQPYRLVADVHADFLEVEWMARRGALASARDAYRGPLLPASDIPAIVAARARLERVCPRRPWRDDERLRAATPVQPSLID